MSQGVGLRRGLPRVHGGEPWPSAVDAERPVAEPFASVPEPAAAGADHTAGEQAATVSAATVAEKAAALPSSSPPSAGATPADTTVSVPLRRSLPRSNGGEPWPPAVTADAASPQPSPSADASPADADSREPAAPNVGKDVVPSTSDAHGVEAVPASETDDSPFRRGLPRTKGGTPWPAPRALPAAGDAAAAAEVARPAAPAPIPEPETASTPDAGRALASEPEPAPALKAPHLPASDAAHPPVDGESRGRSDEGAAALARTEVTSTQDSPGVERSGPRPPLPFTATAWQGVAPRTPSSAPEPRRFGPFTAAQWAGIVIVGGIGALVLAGMAVALVRWILSLDGPQQFLQAYPGEYHLPAGAPVGLPAWVGWQHFFNAFLMVLIIRTGLQVRREKRPSVWWTPRKNKRGRISMNLWIHQALDILWVVNGLVFIVLLFATGQWMRIVPTSWEVFPNALSAGLQYISLDWPTENGWVNYNSLQQLAYFTTVFIAAPLAVVSGVRMSGFWPKKNERLNRLYPVEWARKVHFPVMIYFVVFIVIHVALVFATGALRNLNHMYAAQGSVDGTAYAENWTGFWMFALSIAVIIAGWIAVRPLVVAPIAKLFGNVTAR